jgi:sugar lactone lactonase YvrE
MRIKDFSLQLSDLQFVGQDLNRPESVIAEKDGTLWISDARGLVTRMDPDGRQTVFGDVGQRPNGLAMDTEGNLYNANIGDGKVYKVYRDGSYEVILDQIDGKPLGAANFVFIDNKDRLWISISTRESKAFVALASPRPDGYIILIDENGPRIVGDGIYFTNEIRLDAEEKYLYVAETMQSRMLRFPVNEDGCLGEKEVFGPETLGFGAYVDGFTFDVEGNIWLTTLFRNGLMIITADGNAHTVFEDPVDEAIENLVAKVEAGTLTLDDFYACAGSRLQLLASVTFAGPDLKTVYIGSLAMPCLVSFQSPVPGLPMRHWK